MGHKNQFTGGSRGSRGNCSAASAPSCETDWSRFDFPMNDLYHAAFRSTRRQFLGKATAALGGFALASLLDPALARAASGLPGLIQANPKAKRVIYLFQSGGPAQHDTFDY